LQHKPVPGIILKRAEDNALSKTGYDTAPAEDKYLQLLSFNRPFDHLLDPRIHQNDLTTNDVAYHRAGVDCCFDYHWGVDVGRNMLKDDVSF